MFSLFSKPSPIHSRLSPQVMQRFPRKRALLIGLNHFDYPKQLSKSIANTEKLKESLKLGMYFTDLHTVNDLPSKAVTRQDILDEFDWLVEDATNKDMLFLHFSCLGDKDPIELKSGNITNKDLSDYIFDVLPSGVTLVVSFESDYKGFGMRYVIHHNKNIEFVSIAEKEAMIVLINGPNTVQRMCESFKNYSTLGNFSQFGKVETSQLLDISVPIGRLLASPI